MNKPVRFLIVFIVFLALIIFSRRNDLHTAVAGKAITAFRTNPTAVAAPDHSTLRQKLILLEFFSGL
jgi:hypothetical protein